MNTFPDIPVIGFAAYSGTGKTTLLEKLLPLFSLQQKRVAVLKHSHHTFDIDQPGKDSYRLRQAGAQQLLIASQQRTALIIEHPQAEAEPRLDTLLMQFDCAQLDLILVEGFHHWPFAKIELHRPSLGKPLMFPQDNHIVAIASDAPLPTQPHIPLLNLNHAEEIVHFILQGNF